MTRSNTYAFITFSAITVLVALGLTSAVAAAIAEYFSGVRKDNLLSLNQSNNLSVMPKALDENFKRQVDDCFMPAAAAYGYNLRITSGFRTLKEQQELYEQGRTVDGHIVTDVAAGLSLHNYGYAVDVVERTRAFNINWEKLGAIAAFCGLKQGDEGDLAHIEYRAGFTRAEFAAGLRPPPLELPCSIMAGSATGSIKLTRADLRACGAPEF